VKLPSGQPTILLADSNLASLDKNAALLQEMGLFNHLHAENGSEAVAMIKNFSPEMLILAQDLPDISGLSILSLVRQREDVWRRKTVIIYGGKINERFITRAGRIGVDTVIVSPYDDEYFKSKINDTFLQDEDPKIREAAQLSEKCTVLIESGQLEEALQTCNEIIEINDDAEVYYNMGYILSIKGNFEEALKSFKRATTINNQHARAFKQMGLIYEKLGRLDDAQECLEYAAELHMTLNQETEAEEILNTVLALRPDTTNVYNSLGIIYRHQGRLAESIKAYEKALKVHPKDENVYFNMARAYIELNKIPEAQGSLRRAIELNPGFVAAIDLLRATELGLRLKLKSS
jgi:tetratricopeptide (TPR) repeat protein